jgi:hypothetical protein
MDLRTVLERLRITAAADVFSADWDVSQESMPKGEIRFLTPEYVTWACEAAFLPKDFTQAIVACAGRVAADEPLRSLFWYCHDSLFRAKGRKVEIHRWPLLTEALGNEAGIFNVLVLLSGTPQMQEIHRARGIPAEVIRETVLDLHLVLHREDYVEELGHLGVSPRILNWLMNHWRGELYRLGRLQYIPGKFCGRVRAFRHRQKGTVVALSEDGVRYRADGLVDGAGGVYDKEKAWTATFRTTDSEIIGCPIAPTGEAIHKEMILPASDWKQVLAPGDLVLGVHIPAGPPMSHGLCGESMARALAFFPRYFPDKPVVALTCFSWILDAQFQKLLPPTSNLVRFQKEVYLFPIPSSSDSTLRTVFGIKYKDWGNIPRKTTMQRAFAQHIDKGGHFRGGGCFLLPEDFNWGSQFYRHQRLPW